MRIEEIGRVYRNGPFVRVIPRTSSPDFWPQIEYDKYKMDQLLLGANGNIAISRKEIGVCGGYTESSEKQIKYLIDIASEYKNTGSDGEHGRRDNESVDPAYRANLFPPTYLSLTVDILKKSVWRLKSKEYTDIRFKMPVIEMERFGKIQRRKLDFGEKTYAKILMSYPDLDGSSTLDDFS